MSNYRLEVGIVSRGQGRSVTSAVSYIRGENLYDSFNCKKYYHRRKDVLWRQIFLPRDAPPKYRDPQTLCNEINKSELRRDARTAREFIGSLPNELPTQELIRIVYEFVTRNFVDQGLCAAVAIHEGKNPADPAKNNPHAHIIVSTRTVGPEGFSKKKDREHDKRMYLNIWREQWAKVQNRAYRRQGLDIRVTHESLKAQGKDREPSIHLSRINWQKERRGERTKIGDRNRAVREHNLRRERYKELERTRELHRQREHERGMERER